MSKDLALPGPEMPVIDEDRLLEEFGGDQEILDELTALFLEHVPPLYEAIHTAAEQADAAALGTNAHSLKGTCASFGAPRLARVCNLVEIQARTGDLESAQANLKALAEEYEKVLAAVQDTVSS